MLFTSTMSQTIEGSGYERDINPGTEDSTNPADYPTIPPAKTEEEEQMYQMDNSQGAPTFEEKELLGKGKGILPFFSTFGEKGESSGKGEGNPPNFAQRLGSQAPKKEQTSHEPGIIHGNGR